MPYAYGGGVPHQFYDPHNIRDSRFYEKDDEYHIDLDVPGVSHDDLTIEVKDYVLHVSTRQENTKDNEDNKSLSSPDSKREYHFVFSLPKDINAENIKAQLEKGVLSVTIAKLEEKKPKRIAIQAA